MPTSTIKHRSGNAGGYLVGRKHTQGGIKAINKSNDQPLEMEGGEVVITAPAVEDKTMVEFNGKRMTKRQVLSAINESGGGVAFAKGGDVPKSIKYKAGKAYKLGGKLMTAHQVVKKCGCGCAHTMAKGGVTPKRYPVNDEVSVLHDSSKKENIDLPAASQKHIREIELKISDRKDVEKKQFTSSDQIEKYLRTIWDKDSLNVNESVFVLYLDQANQLIGYEQISKGGVTGSILDPEIVMATASESLAKGVIIAHNHPSGSIKPSQADINITEKLAKALKLVDIRLLDHLILSPTPGEYYSFKDEGEMNYKRGGKLAAGGTIEGKTWTLTFDQFFNEPRQGEFLEALRAVKIPRTEEENRMEEKYSQAMDTMFQNGIGHVISDSGQAHYLKGNKKKIYEKYKKAEDEYMTYLRDTQVAGQRRVYDNAVEKGIIIDPKNKMAAGGTIAGDLSPDEMWLLKMYKEYKPFARKENIAAVLERNGKYSKTAKAKTDELIKQLQAKGYITAQNALSDKGKTTIEKFKESIGGTLPSAYDPSMYAQKWLSLFEDTPAAEATEEPKEMVFGDFMQLLRKLRPYTPEFEIKYLQKLFSSEESLAAVEIAQRLVGIIEKMPKTYQTEDTPTNDKIVYLHYFYAGSDWYIIEKDKLPEQLQTYGYVILNGDLQDAEWGYVSLEEIKATEKIELDFHFIPVRFGELRKKWEPEEEVKPHLPGLQSSDQLKKINHYADKSVTAYLNKTQYQKYEQNEEDNNHSENALLLAKSTGKPDLIQASEVLVAEHDAIGSLTNSLRDLQYKIFSIIKIEQEQPAVIASAAKQSDEPQEPKSDEKPKLGAHQSEYDEEFEPEYEFVGGKNNSLDYVKFYDGETVRVWMEKLGLTGYEPKLIEPGAISSKYPAGWYAYKELTMSLLTRGVFESALSAYENVSKPEEPKSDEKQNDNFEEELSNFKLKYNSNLIGYVDKKGKKEYQINIPTGTGFYKTFYSTHEDVRDAWRDILDQYKAWEKTVKPEEPKIGEIAAANPGRIIIAKPATSNQPPATRTLSQNCLQISIQQ
jgi:DNA repair protein RadC